MKEQCSLRGKYKFTLRNAKTEEVEGIFEYENIIPAVGRTMLANNLAISAATNDPYINYVALGTGTNVPASTDTKLQTEYVRKVVASGDNTANIAYVTGFFGQTEGNTTLKEAGLFSNATGVADSGILLSRVAINITKTASQTLTLDWSLEIT